ncbi:hypothetical protein PQX77_001879 [Marasmius sp. AFHP31]|nr:hypothetical protein PQX77_001879 [Marasmius sp. AFHP31]
MLPSLPLLVLLPLFYIVLSQCLAQDSSTKPVSSVLIYSATAGFRHDSIPTAIQALKAKGPSVSIQFTATEDENHFTDDNLALYNAIVFLSTTGEVLSPSGKTAFQNYLNLGGNFVGIHSASNCLVNDTFYGRQVGESGLCRASLITFYGPDSEQGHTLTIIRHFKMRCVNPCLLVNDTTSDVFPGKLKCAS